MSELPKNMFEKCIANTVDISLFLIIGIPPTSKEYFNWNISTECFSYNTTANITIM